MDWISRRMPGTFQHCRRWMPPAVSKGRERGGTNCPPFECFRQRRVAAAQLLQIVGRIGGVGEGRDDVHQNEPPLVAMKEAPDPSLLKEGHVPQTKTSASM